MVKSSSSLVTLVLRALGSNNWVLYFILRNKMGEAGYQRLKRLFTSEKMVANYDALLQKS
jgi:hypothetical protein